MKFLDSEKLDSLSSLLSFVTADHRLETKIEMYSCKMVHQDKRLFKEMLRADGPSTKASDLKALSSPINEDDSFPTNLSPPVLVHGFKSIRHTSGSSDVDPDSEDGSHVLCDAINCKRLFDLIGVLNASFADYDFSAAKGENFSKVLSFDIVKRLIDGKYSSIALKPYTAIQQKLWTLIDESIDLKACKFYTYNPDYDSDPYSEDGCTWSFNYFFYNSQLKRVLFFTSRAFNYQACLDSTIFGSELAIDEA